MMSAGPLVAGAGFTLMLGITADADYLTQVLPAVLVFGLGLAVTVAPLTATVLGAVEPAHSGIASATNNAVSRVAGLIAVALAGSIGGSAVIDLESFHQLVAAAAGAMLIGAVVSAAGIRNPPAAPDVGTVRPTGASGLAGLPDPSVGVSRDTVPPPR